MIVPVLKDPPVVGLHNPPFVSLRRVYYKPSFSLSRLSLPPRMHAQALSIKHPLGV